jgi:ribosomal protein S19E (S16A)
LHTAEREPNATTVIYRLMHGELRGASNVPWQAIRAEDAVRAVHKRAPEIAAALRAYYCGRGRRSVERYQTFRKLIRRHVARKVFFELVETGLTEVESEMLAL